ncbi:spexin prohormone 2-like [Aquarana catesbeiana]|uniref:spexin prohormone 2-like n=1 Tax=Aquarana catesbeiana TaxID=8400 RepID=UPI003CC9B2D2
MNFEGCPLRDSDTSSNRVTRRIMLYLTCTILLLILSESLSAPKNKLMARNWGPQSMLYLKGRHGRRFVSDYEEQYQKIHLASWNSILKRYLFLFGTEKWYTKLWKVSLKKKKSQL